ncbi:unnamed protein product [Prorocentrum cordatum]|uniref:Ankyrin repeat domain-containing protein n=1 Tax=Prorocentrum cordatum TaxID=2364126 RepID=A0ABN9VYP2_9DINO|nr:unnamed protein product [Polarella glacialis]
MAEGASAPEPSLGGDVAGSGSTASQDLAHEGAGGRRFGVGAAVLCRSGEDAWVSGRVVSVDFRDEAWPPGRVEPYVVALDDGSDSVFVHLDSEDAVRCARSARRCAEPWWAAIFKDRPGSHFARGAPAEVAELGRLSAGRDVDEQDERGENALLISTRYSWLAGVQELLDPDVVNDLGHAPLHLALLGIGREAAMVGALLHGRADPSRRGSAPGRLSLFDELPESEAAGLTPLHCSAAAGMLDISRALVEARADIDARHALGETALRLSIAEGHTEVADFLLSARADVDAGPDLGTGMTLLMEAAREGDGAFARRLLELGARVDRRGRQDLTPLHLAARSGHVELSRLLLDHGADRALRSQLGTALELAARRSGSELRELLAAA